MIKRNGKMKQIIPLIKHDNELEIRHSTFNRVKIAQSLFGILTQDTDTDNVKEERLADKF